MMTKRRDERIGEMVKIMRQAKVVLGTARKDFRFFVRLSVALLRKIPRKIWVLAMTKTFYHSFHLHVASHQASVSFATAHRKFHHGGVKKETTAVAESFRKEPVVERVHHQSPADLFRQCLPPRLSRRVFVHVPKHVFFG